MHTLIAYWHRSSPATAPVSVPVSISVSAEVALLNLKGWGISAEGMTAEQVQLAYLTKRRQLDEMESQFSDGEKSGEGIGLIRVGRSMDDRTGSWPPWLFEILAKRLNYDAVNKQFYFKHPDDRKLMEMNGWMFRIKDNPLLAFLKRYPFTVIRNVFHLGALMERLKADTRYFNVSAIDQPEKGEDGYYHFRDNSFWEDSGE